MTLCVLSLFAAEARKSSTISLKSGDLLRYLIFHFAQSVPAGALLASSTTFRSLFSELVRIRKGCIDASGPNQIRYQMCFLCVGEDGFQRYIVLTVQEKDAPGPWDDKARVERYGLA